MLISPSAMSASERGFGLGRGLLLDRASDLGANDRLVEVQLAIEFGNRFRGRVQVEHHVDAFTLVVDLVSHPTTTPNVHVIDGAAVATDDVEERLQAGLDRLFFQIGVEDDHDLVMTHELPTSFGLCGPGSLPEQEGSLRAAGFPAALEG